MIKIYRNQAHVCSSFKTEHIYGKSLKLEIVIPRVILTQMECILCITIGFWTLWVQFWGSQQQIPAPVSKILKTDQLYTYILP